MTTLKLSGNMVTVPMAQQTPAVDRPELAKSLIFAIMPLQDYLLTQSARNTQPELWKFTIEELKEHLTNLVESVNGVI